MAPAGLEWEDAEALNVTELISGFSMLVSESMLVAKDPLGVSLLWAFLSPSGSFAGPLSGPLWASLWASLDF